MFVRSEEPTPRNKSLRLKICVRSHPPSIRSQERQPLRKVVVVCPRSIPLITLEDSLHQLHRTCPNGLLFSQFDRSEQFSSCAMVRISLSLSEPCIAPSLTALHSIHHTTDHLEVPRPCFVKCSDLSFVHYAFASFTSQRLHTFLILCFLPIATLISDYSLSKYLIRNC